MLAAAVVLVMAAWPQMSYSQFRQFRKVPKVKVPTPRVPQILGPAIGAGVHGYGKYQKVLNELQSEQIAKLPGADVCRPFKAPGVPAVGLGLGKVTGPQPSQAVRDYSQREALYVRGVEAGMKGDSAKYKSLVRRSSDALYAPAQYLHALTLLKEGGAHESEAFRLLELSAFGSGYGPAYYFLYLCAKQNYPTLADGYLAKSVDAACFDALVTAGTVSWEKGDTLNAEDCWWTAYRKELWMDSVLNVGGRKRTPEYFRTYAERSNSVVGEGLPSVYNNLLWIKYAKAQTRDELLDCMRLCEYVEPKQHTPYVDWVLSEFYRGYGDVAPVDYTEAVRHLKLAAQAYPEAKTSLANMYYVGLGCERDSAYASTLYEEAARDGSVGAMDMVARMCYDAKQWDRMTQWGTRPELADSLEIQYLVGLAYVFNEECDKSIGYFARAADAGNVDAMWMAYSVCDSIAPDDPRKLKYLRMAADAGMAKALNDLGYYYAFGNSVELDVAEAIRLFDKAKDGGCLYAYNNLGVLHYGRPVVDGRKLDRNLAAAYWREGAEKGEPNSMYNYAMLQIKGRCGVKKDKSQGYALMRKAADMGVEEARQFLDKR